MSFPLNGATASSAGGDPISRAVERKADLQSAMQTDRTMAAVTQARMEAQKKPVRVIGSNG